MFEHISGSKYSSSKQQTPRKEVSKDKEEGRGGKEEVDGAEEHETFIYWDSAQWWGGRREGGRNEGRKERDKEGGGGGVNQCWRLWRGRRISLGGGRRNPKWKLPLRLTSHLLNNVELQQPRGDQRPPAAGLRSVSTGCGAARCGQTSLSLLKHLTEIIVIDPSDIRLPRTHSASSFTGSIFHLLFIELPERAAPETRRSAAPSPSRGAAGWHRCLWRRSSDLGVVDGLSVRGRRREAWIPSCLAGKPTLC